MTKVWLLTSAILFIYLVFIPFIMSDEFDRLAIQFGLDDLSREIFWPHLVGR
jgi:hypothetical protein